MFNFKRIIMFGKVNEETWCDFQNLKCSDAPLLIAIVVAVSKKKTRLVILLDPSLVNFRSISLPQKNEIETGLLCTTQMSERKFSPVAECVYNLHNKGLTVTSFATHEPVANTTRLRSFSSILPPTALVFNVPTNFKTLHANLR